MTGTGTTPGRAAYEAWRETCRSDAPWSDIAGDQEREAWEAAAQAAIAAHFAGSEPVPPVVVHFDGTFSDADEATLREKFAEALRTQRPQFIHEPRPAPELAAAMAETRRVTETVRPVLDSFRRASDGWRGRVSAVVLARAYAATGTVPDYLKHVEGQ